MPRLGGLYIVVVLPWMALEELRNAASREYQSDWSVVQDDDVDVSRSRAPLACEHLVVGGEKRRPEAQKDAEFPKF